MRLQEVRVMEDGFWFGSVTLRDMPLSGIPQDDSSVPLSTGKPESP